MQNESSADEGAPHGGSGSAAQVNLWHSQALSNHGFFGAQRRLPVCVDAGPPSNIVSHARRTHAKAGARGSTRFTRGLTDGLDGLNLIRDSLIAVAARGHASYLRLSV
jgi:hypothetical protein